MADNTNYWILRADARKASGAVDRSCSWYVARLNVINGEEYYSVTMDRNRAMRFNSNMEAREFNNRQISLGNMSEPFEIVKI